MSLYVGLVVFITCIAHSTFGHIPFTVRPITRLSTFICMFATAVIFVHYASSMQRTQQLYLLLFSLPARIFVTSLFVCLLSFFSLLFLAKWPGFHLRSDRRWSNDRCVLACVFLVFSNLHESFPRSNSVWMHSCRHACRHRQSCTTFTRTVILVISLSDRQEEGNEERK